MLKLKVERHSIPFSIELSDGRVAKLRFLSATSAMTKEALKISPTDRAAQMEFIERALRERLEVDEKMTEEERAKFGDDLIMEVIEDIEKHGSIEELFVQLDEELGKSSRSGKPR